MSTVSVLNSDAQLNAKTLALIGSANSGNLLFTDATYDIGQSGATRPRDIFLSRNAVIGGTLLQAGIATFSALITLTGGQIGFPATQVPSADVNTLDDYEEGVWTPVIGGSGGTSGQTYSAQTGTYIKIGQQVFATFAATLSVKGTITGAVEIQGYPFPCVGGGATDVATLSWSTMATNWVFMQQMFGGGSTTSRTEVRGAQAAAITSNTSLTTADIAATTGLRGSIAYRTTA